MKLSAYARSKGISYRTAHRMFQAGKIPHPTEQLPTGTIIVHAEEPATTKKTVLYARVSSSKQKEDLTRQVQRLRDYCAAQGLKVDKEVTEVGSALNGKRKRLLRVLSDQAVGTIVVEHRDRLTRFGFEYLEASFQAQNRRIIVLNDTECKDDLVQDMIDVLTSFCARLYGRRSARLRAKRAVEVLTD